MGSFTEDAYLDASITRKGGEVITASFGDLTFVSRPASAATVGNDTELVHAFHVAQALGAQGEACDGLTILLDTVKGYLRV